MKKKRILLFFMLLGLFLLSGCTVEYDLTINKDLSLDEKMVVFEKNEFFEQYVFSTPKEVMQAVLKSHEDKLDTLKYEYTINNSNQTTLTNHYDSYSFYISENSITKQFFEEMSTTQQNGIVTIKNTGEFVPYTEGNPDYFQVEEININIEVPYKVIQSNADKVDKKTNTYTWTITKDTMEKSFLLQFDTSKTFLTSSDKFNIIGIVILVLVGVGIVFIGYLAYKKYTELSK